MIIALENAKYELVNFRENIKELGDALKISELKVEVENLEVEPEAEITGETFTPDDAQAEADEVVYVSEG